MSFWCIFRTRRGFRCRRATRSHHGRGAVVVLALPARPTALEVLSAVRALELADESATRL